ncbi:putative quinol monooxygenase [Streptomyces sp. NPDC020096]
MMSQIGLLVRIEAKPEFADQVEQLLCGAVELARKEEGTLSWFAFRESPTVFGVFDTFTDEQGRTAHIEGKIADALRAAVPTMLTGAPEVRRTDILAVKLP